MTCLRRVFSVGSRVSELVCDLQDRISRQALHTEKRVDSRKTTCVYLQSLSDQLFQVAVRQIRMLSTSRTQYAIKNTQKKIIKKNTQKIFKKKKLKKATTISSSEPPSLPLTASDSYPPPSPAVNACTNAKIAVTA